MKNRAATKMREAEAESILTEADLSRIASLDLRSPEILAAVCKIAKIYLTTEQYTRGEDRWYATPSDAPVFSGSLLEVSAYVRGYATAWRAQRARARVAIESVARDALEKIDGSR
jgi:hypothetical protein